MPAIWMTFAGAATWSDVDQVARRLGWRKGEAFHPSDGSFVPESAYVAADGTRIAAYLGFVGTNHPRDLAVYGDAPGATADAVAAAIAVRDRREEARFRRLQPLNTAVTATDDGVWWLRSAAHEIAFAPRTAADDEDEEVVAAATISLSSPFALAAGSRAVYATSCNEPDDCWLVRIDRETHALAHLCRLDRPTQLAVIGDIAYAVVAARDVDPGGEIYARRAAELVAIDRTGAIERVPLAGLPPPRLLAASPTTGALCWIDTAHKHVVEYRAGAGRVIGGGEHLVALDADDDRVYALDYGSCAIAIEPGAREPRTIAVGDMGTAGILRLGPLLVTLYSQEESWRASVHMRWVGIGFPRLADAPAALVAAARDHAEDREVLADWLTERGVPVTPDLLERTLAVALADLTGYEDRGSYTGLPDDLAVQLATHDRLTGYTSRDGKAHRFTAAGLF